MAFDQILIFSSLADPNGGFLLATLPTLSLQIWCFYTLLYMFVVCGETLDRNKHRHNGKGSAINYIALFWTVFKTTTLLKLRIKSSPQAGLNSSTYCQKMAISRGMPVHVFSVQTTMTITFCLMATAQS